MSLDATERLVGVIVRLLDQTQLLTLGLVQTRLHAIRFLQPLQG